MAGAKHRVVEETGADRVRAELGLPARRPAKRSCLRCSKKFASAGTQHRICEPCSRLLSATNIGNAAFSNDV